MSGELAKVVKNAGLRDFNTFRVSAVAKYFSKVKNQAEAGELLARKLVLPKDILVLGKGANVLFVDNYQGLVIKNELSGRKIVSENAEEVVVEAASGESWHEFVTWTAQNGWSGLENMAGIPGTVGAAPVGNIAAYGQNFEDVCVSVKALELASGVERVFSKDDCHFVYRDSGFKRDFKDKYFVTSVVMRLFKEPRFDTNYHSRYESLKDQLNKLGKKPPYTPKVIAAAVVSLRSEKLPDWRKVGTAGSVFKNPVVSVEKFKDLSGRIKELQYYPVDKLGYQIHDWKAGLETMTAVKIPVARLLDELGWRGKRIGGVVTFERHALCVVNFGGASGREIYEFTEKMREDVKKNYGIDLEYEVQIIPSRAKR